jgi:mono/diheme cytochrome c family protein
MRKAFILVIAGLFLVGGLFWSSGAVLAQSSQGQQVYSDKCAMCHGQNGQGNGPASSSFSPAPANFTSAAFWQGNVNQKITSTIENGHGPMPAIELSSGQIKALINYMTQTFKPGS